MKQLIMKHLLVLIVVSVGFTGCAYNSTNYAQSKLASDLTATAYDSLSIADVDEVKAEPEIEWWHQFQMPELNVLLSELHLNSYDLAIARERIRRSRALLRQQRSFNFPSVNASFTGRRTALQSTDATAGRERISEEGSLLFNAAYEVDMWGSRSAANHAAELGVVAEQAQHISLMLTLQAQVAEQYFTILSFQDRIDIVEQNLEATEEIMNLVQLRFDAGRASGIELDQQRTVMLAQRGQLILLQQDLEISKRALATLLGSNTLPTDITGNLENVSIPAVNVVQPASLLESRPDIVFAETALRINDAVVFQNKAKRWPSLQLSADATLANLFKSGPFWATSLIGQLSAPLFNAGRIKAEIEVAEADASIALQTYQKTVIQAIEEVLNTLTELNHQRDIYTIRQEELDTNRRLYDLALTRFEAGNIDFINVLDAQRSWFASTEQIISAKRNHLASVINTFKAMGVPPDYIEEAF